MEAYEQFLERKNEQQKKYKKYYKTYYSVNYKSTGFGFILYPNQRTAYAKIGRPLVVKKKLDLLIYMVVVHVVAN